MPTRLFGTLLLAAALQAATTLHISPDGDDSFPGTPTQPLKTLLAARNLARTAAHPVTIQLRAGTYRLAETFVLDARDSGVTWTAAPGERAVISGGRAITGWKQTSGGLWQAVLPDVRDGRWYFRQLSVNGRRATRARTPNVGYLRADGPKLSDTKPFQIHFRAGDIKPSWAGPGDVEVVALYAWADIRMPIRAVDEQTRRVTLAGNALPYTGEDNARYYIENAPDALDAPGEWYLDRRTGVLSYMPRAGEDVAKAEIVAPVLTKLVLLEDAVQVVFRNLIFRDADSDIGPDGYADAQAAIEIGPAIIARGARECAIEDSVIESVGGYALEIGGGCKRNRIVRNEIRDIGAGGVRIGGGKGGTAVGQAPETAPALDNVISDNDLHDLGVVYPSGVGIWIGHGALATVIAHNHIHNLDYTGISVCWSWGYAPQVCDGHRIEYNHIHDVGRGVLADMGGIYTLGIQPHTVLRNNLIHDITVSTYGGWGIYLDEGSTGILVENNIVYAAAKQAFNMHYGRENMVRNNVFVGGETAVSYTRVEDHLGFTMTRNILYNPGGKLLNLAEEKSAAACGADSPKHEAHTRVDCRHYRLAGNIYYAPSQPRSDTGNDDAPVVADPAFVNAAANDYRLRPDSPALKAGFMPIDLTGVGPRKR